MGDWGRALKKMDRLEQKVCWGGGARTRGAIGNAAGTAALEDTGRNERRPQVEHTPLLLLWVGGGGHDDTVREEMQGGKGGIQGAWGGQPSGGAGLEGEKCWRGVVGGLWGSLPGLGWGAHTLQACTCAL